MREYPSQMLPVLPVMPSVAVAMYAKKVVSVYTKESPRRGAVQELSRPGTGQHTVCENYGHSSVSS